MHRRGLGRGRGFAVSETFSVLDEPAVTGPIAKRCRIILGLIEGGKILSVGEASIVRAELERWKGEALREKKARDDLLAKLAEVEGQTILWRNEASRLRGVEEEQAAELAILEEEASRWKGVVSELRARAPVNRMRSMSSRTRTLMPSSDGWNQGEAQLGSTHVQG